MKFWRLNSDLWKIYYRGQVTAEQLNFMNQPIKKNEAIETADECVIRHRIGTVVQNLMN
jgi:hypothetical protein